MSEILKAGAVMLAVAAALWASGEAVRSIQLGNYPEAAGSIGMFVVALAAINLAKKS